MMAKRVKAKSSVFEHFKITEDGKHFVCQCLILDDTGTEVKYCEAKISAFTSLINTKGPSRSSNLKRHLMRRHSEVLKEVNEKDEKTKELILSQRTSKVPRNQKDLIEVFKCMESYQNTFSNQSTSDSLKDKVAPTDQKDDVKPNVNNTSNLTANMTVDIFKHHIIELVAKNGVPLGLFSQPGFLGLIGESASNVGVSLQRENIRNMVIEEAENQKKMLKRFLQDRFVFLKLDACTYHKLNYFTINIRFINDQNELVISTLSTTDIQAHYTSEYLQQLVEHVLEDFGIKKERVLSFVTDNASNMVKDIEKLDKDFEETDLQFETHHDLDELLACVDKADDFNHSCETGQGYLDSLDNFLLDAASRVSGVQHMCCGAHTLYLAVHDSLQETHAATLLSKIRKVVRAAKTPKLDQILIRFTEKGLLIDEASHWESTYLMIQRLLDLKPFLIDMDNLQVTLTETQWQQAKELEKVLRHPFILMKKLQTEDLTPGIFLKEWKNLMFRLSKTGGIMANGLLDAMKIREFNLLDNKMLLAAVYVDPMHRILLEEEQLTKAKAALFEISVRMHGMQETHIESTIPALSSSNSNSDDELDFDKLLDRMECAKRRRLDMPPNTPNSPAETTLKKFTQDFYQALEEVEKYDRASKLKVKEAISVYPEIVRDAAHIVVALPTTRGSLKPLLSAFHFIRYDTRTAMKDDDLLEAILFLRTNYF